MNYTQSNFTGVRIKATTSFLEASIFKLYISVTVILEEYCDDIAYLKSISKLLKKNIYQSSKQMAAKTEDRLDCSGGH